jgi:hypothetical protein
MKRIADSFRCGICVGLIAPLVACGGGTVSSGRGADTATGDIAGIYEGAETLSLLRVDDEVVVDASTNTLRIVVSGRGTVTLSSANGSSGQARVTKERTFRMRADARTHFTGRCSTGIVILDGRFDANKGIVGRYRSEDLTCRGEPHNLEGEFAADRV